MKMFFEKEVLALVEMFDSLYDEETGEVKEQDKDILKGLAHEQIAPTMERYKKASEFYENQAELIAEEIKRLQDRKRMFENKSKHIKSRLLFAVEQLGGKFKSLLYTFGKRVTKSVEVSDNINFNDLPKELVKVKYEVDKKAAKELLEKGQTINGIKIVENTNLFVK